MKPHGCGIFRIPSTSASDVSRPRSGNAKGSEVVLWGLIAACAAGLRTAAFGVAEHAVYRTGCLDYDHAAACAHAPRGRT